MLEQILTVGEFKGRVISKVTSIEKSVLGENQKESDKLERIGDYNWKSFVYISLLGFGHEEASKFIREQEYIDDCYSSLSRVLGEQSMHNEAAKKYGKDIPLSMELWLEHVNMELIIERIGNLPSHSRMLSNSVKRIAYVRLIHKEDVEERLEQAYKTYCTVYEKCKSLLNEYGNVDNIITTGLENIKTNGLENLTPAELGIFKGIFEKKISNNQAPL